MISILDSVKNLYKSDSVMKKYFVVFRDYGQMKDNTEITGESLQITESICSAGNFKVGLCESGNCKISVVLDDNVKGDEITVFQVLGDFEPEITIDETKGLQISEADTVELESTFTSTNIISGLDGNNFEKNKDYLILAKFKYIGNPIYLYVETPAGNSRMVYYLKPGLFNFSNLEDWDSTKTYIENEIVIHNDFIWKSLTYDNTVEPGSLVNGEPTNAWENITKYVQVSIPLIGSEFYDYKLGVYVNTDEVYGTLSGDATIYELPVPIMPLGLFTITDCKKKNDSNIRALTGYDRMQDVGLNVDVYFVSPNPGNYPTTAMGLILDEAAQNTQIVIGSNLSKEPVNPTLVSEEIVPFPDFPQDDETTVDEDEGIIYQVTKSESQYVEGDIIESNEINKEYDTTLYMTLKSSQLLDAEDSRWYEYLDAGSLVLNGQVRKWKSVNASRSYTPPQYGWVTVGHWYWETNPEGNGEWYFDGEYSYWSGDQDPRSHTNGEAVQEYRETRPGSYSEWRYTDPGNGYVYSYEVVKSDTSKTRYYYKDVDYGYNFSRLDNTWTHTNCYFPASMNIPDSTSYRTPSGGYVKTYGYIDCTKQFNWKYDYDYNFINRLLASNWVLSQSIGSDKTNYRLISTREGERYEDQNINIIFSLDSVYSTMKKVYARQSIYKWYETATLKKMTYQIPNYDNTMAYTVYITYPTDTLAYIGENQVYELALDQVDNHTSDDGTYTSSGVLDINNQDLVHEAILDNCTKVAEVTSGIFYIYWVSELTYDCTIEYNESEPISESSLSGRIIAANPYNSCVVHSKAEKFNSMPIQWQSDSIHGTRRSVISGFMELHGMFINFDRWGVSTTRNVKSSTLYPAENLYPHDSTIPGLEEFGDIYPTIGSTEVTAISICKSIYIDDDLNTDFDGVLISKSQVTSREAGLYPFYYNRRSKRYGTIPSTMPEIAHVAWEGNKYYKIENNFFIDNFIFTQEQLVEICKLILDNVGNLQYFNLTAELRALPYMEVGDNIDIMTPKNGYETAILRRTMKGNIAQMDSIETDFYD